MSHTRIIWPFWIVALFFCLNPLVPVMAFGPLLALCCWRYSLISTLWLSALCGLCIDLLSAHPFGVYSLTYTCITCILFRYRIYFVEKPVGLASFTLLMSMLSTAISRSLLFLYGSSLPVTVKGSITDFIVLPCCDGIYALLCFSYPVIIYRFLKRHGFHFLFLRKVFKKKEQNKVSTHG